MLIETFEANVRRLMSPAPAGELLARQLEKEQVAHQLLAQAAALELLSQGEYRTQLIGPSSPEVLSLEAILMLTVEMCIILGIPAREVAHRALHRAANGDLEVGDILVKGLTCC